MPDFTAPAPFRRTTERVCESITGDIYKHGAGPGLEKAAYMIAALADQIGIRVPDIALGASLGPASRRTDGREPPALTLSKNDEERLGGYRNLLLDLAGQIRDVAHRAPKPRP